MSNDLFAVADKKPFLVVEHPCVPKGKGRPRGRIVQPKNKPAFIHFYTDSDTEAYEKALAWRARTAMKGREPETGPLALRVFSMMPIAKSWSQREKDAAVAGTKFHMGTPDTDNIFKAVADAFNGIVYADDKQIVKHYCHKEYGENPGLIVECYRLP